MRKLILLAGLLVSCGDNSPALEKCPFGTRSYVCFKPGLATCENDNLEQVTGCYVQATETVQLICVPEC